MSEKIKKAWPHLLFKTCIFVALSITSAFLLVAGFSTLREYHFGYKESGDIEYIVGLKNGNFLNAATLPAGETYYSDALESINATFKYGANFTDPVTGEYYYYLTAAVSGEEKNGDIIWTKTEQISDSVTKHLLNSKKIRITVKELIDYPSYDQILRQFSEQYRTLTGTLKVSLVIKGNFTTEVMDRPVVLDSVIDLSIPLAKESVKISASTNTDNDGKLYTKVVNIDDDNHRFCRFAGAMLLIAIAYLAVSLFYSARAERRKHIYEYTVNKLREDYDNIIVDLKTAPKIAKLHVANVMEFDELLDVYNSIKQPINYYETKDGAHFILINDRLAWQYVIKKHESIKKPAQRHRASHRRK